MAEQARIGATDRQRGLSKATLTSANKSPTVAYVGSKASDRMNLRSYPAYSSGSGYVSNQRPVLFYKPSLDLIDNPQFGQLISDNLMSQTKLHYQPPTLSDGSEVLPSLLDKPSVTGYHHIRTFSQTQPMEEKSEYQSMFVPHRLTPPVSRLTKLGPKGETGFTEGTNLQFNTFRDKKSCAVEPHQTSSSVMKNDFLSPFSLQDIDSVPGVCSRSCRETGYTRGAIDLLINPNTDLPSPETRSSPPAVKATGKKELSGFCLNMPNEIFSKPPFDPSHFRTHYEHEFCHSQQKDSNPDPPVGIVNTSHTMDNSYNHRNTDKCILNG